MYKKKSKQDYKYIFKSFAKFSSWNYDDIVYILHQYADRIVLSLLELFNNGKLFLINKVSEYNTMSGNSWPKDHNLKFVAKENILDTQTNKNKIQNTNFVLAEINISYCYCNPRDGDGWSLDINFNNADLKDTFLKLRTFSHSDVPKISITIDKEYSDFIKNIESLFNQIFQESSVLEKE